MARATKAERRRRRDALAAAVPEMIEVMDRMARVIDHQVEAQRVQKARLDLLLAAAAVPEGMVPGTLH